YKRQLADEQKIECEQLLQEIEPLVKEYFVCDVGLTEEGLKLSFSNGQSFVLFFKENSLN
ncbi:hypothetical protein QIG69_27295, partial [Klebsiella pneumoniae]|nr:hypothetical protein [Klebsiella pneumoniae]